ncbi:MAG: type II secretion system minor pseudopilin GspI [Oleiphilaceae bacterium]|nr:type II secretion system minor pseudopilin GspI [Oleiphilaceae bacterium]
MHKPTRRHSRGFTLMEVMIALMIFGMLALTIQQVSSGYMGSYQRLEGQTMAVWIAQNRLAEMRLAEDMPGTGESDEELRFGPHEWELGINVTDTEDPTIRRVEITVSRINEVFGRQRQRVVTGFLGAN